MFKKNKKIQSDKIFVKSKVQPKSGSSSTMDDIGLLALQIACTQRTDVKPNDLDGDIDPIEDFYCITIETRKVSSLIFIGTLHEENIQIYVQNLRDQINNIIKSCNEKIYYLDLFKLNRKMFPFAHVMVNTSLYSFLWDMPKADMIVSYFPLEKKQEKERFKPVSLNQLSSSPVETDMYLFFPRNNRYIHYLKKGAALEDHRKSKLTKKGFQNFFTPSDQPLDAQFKRVDDFISDLLIRYELITGAA